MYFKLPIQVLPYAHRKCDKKTNMKKTVTTKLAACVTLGTICIVVPRLSVLQSVTVDRKSFKTLGP